MSAWSPPGGLDWGFGRVLRYRRKKQRKNCIRAKGRRKWSLYICQEVPGWKVKCERNFTPTWTRKVEKVQCRSLIEKFDQKCLIKKLDYKREKPQQEGDIASYCRAVVKVHYDRAIEGEKAHKVISFDLLRRAWVESKAKGKLPTSWIGIREKSVSRRKWGFPHDKKTAHYECRTISLFSQWSPIVGNTSKL